MHSKLATNMDILGHGYGQLRTFDSGRPTDDLGHSLPWFTYPTIEYLKRFDCSGWRVFEYGAGESTSYWCRRGAIVTSVEHNEEWFTEMKRRSLPGATIWYRSDRDAYANAIREAGTRFDAIVIDGVFRETCAEVCTEYLNEGGMLILDNSDWYHQTGARIREMGFLEVSFSGFGPVNDYTWTTSLFFKTVSRGHSLSSPDPIGGLVLRPDAVDQWW
ncbi:SAM-dependent methyltransferase [Bradyrhizobium vignae]|uniref:Pcmt-protein-L-isoaspartate o-methyltransferase n=1 Tax=Bradyrhizobium vignae TaxID=1549949 RepID=A0A2U3PYB6_9BRAD